MVKELKKKESEKKEIGIGKAVDSRSFSMSYYGEKPTKGVEQVFSSKEKKNNRIFDSEEVNKRAEETETFAVAARSS